MFAGTVDKEVLGKITLALLTLTYGNKTVCVVCISRPTENPCSDVEGTTSQCLLLHKQLECVMLGKSYLVTSPRPLFLSFCTFFPVPASPFTKGPVQVSTGGRGMEVMSRHPREQRSCTIRCRREREAQLSSGITCYKQ